MIVMGLNAWHGDASAALAVDGRVVAAVEEERFRRVKHWAGFPLEAIRSCLAIAGVEAGAVTHWAINSDGAAHRWRKLAYLARGAARPGLVLSRLGNRRRRRGAREEVAESFGLDPAALRVHPVEHHLCHLASARHPAGFDDAWLVSVDGFGDFASAAWARQRGGQGGALVTGGQVYFPHSLGVFYQAMTQYLGFPAYGDEYKVMGLASYGEPAMVEDLMRLVTLLPGGGFALDTDYFRHHRDAITFSFDNGTPEFAPLFSGRLEQWLGQARTPGSEITGRHKDLAASVQRIYEMAFFHLLNALHERDPCDQLALAGGCAQNSVANGRIRSETPFRSVYVQPAAGDAGGALGAALEISRRLGAVHPEPMPNAYLGPSYHDADIAELIDRQRDALARAGCRVDVLAQPELLDTVLTVLEEGGVAGWFQGRMEWGARALGNRSILGDPRRTDMQEILNLKIKRRESFRPFAPSILREHVADWFETDDDVPYMQKVYPIRAERRATIPAVTHVDGSGRLQTVCREQNPLYHRLISRFHERTGVPLLLNTSFNENEPIVCQPSEALDCFLRTRMDLLVLGNHVIRRNPS